MEQTQSYKTKFIEVSCYPVGYLLPPTLMIRPPLIFSLVIPSDEIPPWVASSPSELPLERLLLSSKQKWLLTLVL